MNRKLIVMSVFVAILALLAGNASAQPGTPPGQLQALASPVTTAFTYQGQVKKNGGAYTGACDFKFGLWDAATAGTQQGTTQSAPGVNVANGLFTVELNFGDQFKGDARWLEIAVNCGDGAFTTMSPRILMTSSPYALSLRPGATINGTGTTGLVVNTPNGNPIAGYTQANGYSAVYGGDSSAAGGFGLRGLSNKGIGVWGQSTDSSGVVGKSSAWVGVYGESANQTAVWGQSTFATGVAGTSSNGFGVHGKSVTGSGVVGESSTWIGVYGESPNQFAVWGKSTSSTGVAGTSSTGIGVSGTSGAGVGVYGESANQTAVFGKSTSATGVYGLSSTGFGAYGKSTNGSGVVGESVAWIGVYGVSTNSDGIRGVSHSAGHSGVVGVNDAGGYAGYFAGKVGIQGGADLAELFDLSDESEPGTLMVIDGTKPGQLKASDQAYDTRVAGIVSGAGGVNPGLTLHQEGVLTGDTHVAIAGRVYVKAEAFSTPIKPGDLLTTSGVKGHAMKAADRERATGAIIGKAMTGLESGTGLVLVLVNLQ